MTTIATLVVKVTGDSAGLRTAMGEAANTSKQTADKISKNLKDIGGSMQSTGAMMTAGLTLPLAAAGMAAINYASDLDESKNKVTVVFGDMSAAVLEWSETSATAMGQSQQEALEAASTYGNLFQAMGLGQGMAMDMSTSLVQLAADLASFNNADPSDVLNAIKSGMIGQSEPMTRFGVDLRDRVVQLKAVQMGLIEEGDAMSEAIKMQARYAILMEQTSMAQGDFARTSDGLANQQRIVKAQFKDMAATLGTQLMPYALKLMEFLSGLIDKFEALSPQQQKWILGIGVAVAVIGPLLAIIGTLISAIGAIIPIVTAVAGVISFPLIAIIAAVIAIIALLYTAWTQNWGGIQEKFAAFVAWIKPIWDTLWLGISTVFQVVWANIQSIFAAFKAAFEGDWYTFGAKLREAWDRSWNFIITILRNINTIVLALIKTMIKGIIDFIITTDWKSVGANIVKGIAEGIKNGIKWVVDAAKRVAKAALDAAKGALGIHSKSTLFENVIGKNMALGMVSGWEGVLNVNPLQPALANAAAVSTPNFKGGGGAARGSQEVVVNVYNPVPEPASQSVRREMTKLNYVGIPK